MTTATSSSINWNLGNVQYLTLTSSPTLTFTNGQAGGQYTLIVNQDATGNRSVTWPSSVRWSDGIEPGLSTSASSTDLITFVFDGSRYLGSYQLAMGALAENLISYWKLDESSGNASDSIGSNTLTNNNSTTYSSGKINNAGNFVASSSNYFSSGTSNGFPTGSSPRSVSLWFKLNSLPSDSTNYIFFNYGSETTNGAFGLSVNGGTGSNRSLNLFGYSNDLTYSVSNIQTGTWYHYVGTFDGTTAKIYLNGALATSGNKSSWNTSSGTAARIGALISASPGFFMDGLVDEVGIWSRTLTSDEVNTLYNSGSGRQM